jgi:hypothetical protein
VANTVRIDAQFDASGIIAGLRGVHREIETFSQQTNQAFNQVRASMALLAGVGGTRELINSYREAASAQRFLQSVVRETGGSYETAQKQAESFARSVGLSVTDAQRFQAQARLTLEQAGRPRGLDADTLTRGIADLAAARGVDRNRIPDLLRSILTNDESLNALGLPNPQTLIEQRLAAQGLKPSQVSEQRRNAEILAGVMEAANRNIGEAERSMSSAIGRLDQLNARLETLKSRLGEIAAIRLADQGEAFAAAFERPGFLNAIGLLSGATLGGILGGGKGAVVGGALGFNLPNMGEQLGRSWVDNSAAYRLSEAELTIIRQQMAVRGAEAARAFLAQEGVSTGAEMPSTLARSTDEEQARFIAEGDRTIAAQRKAEADAAAERRRIQADAAAFQRNSGAQFAAGISGNVFVTWADESTNAIMRLRDQFRGASVDIDSIIASQQRLSQVEFGKLLSQNIAQSSDLGARISELSTVRYGVGAAIFNAAGVFQGNAITMGYRRETDTERIDRVLRDSAEIERTVFSSLTGLSPVDQARYARQLRNEFIVNGTAGLDPNAPISAVARNAIVGALSEQRNTLVQQRLEAIINNVNQKKVADNSDAMVKHLESIEKMLAGKKEAAGLKGQLNISVEDKDDVVESVTARSTGAGRTIVDSGFGYYEAI